MKGFIYITLLAGIIASPYLNAKSFLKVESGAHTAAITKLHVTSNSKYVVTTANDKTIRVWDTETGKESRKILGYIGSGPDGMIHDSALSRDNRYLAVVVHRGETHNKPGTQDDTKDIIRLYDFHQGKILKVIKPQNSDDILSINFNDSGEFLVSGSEDHSVTVWSIKSLLESQSSEPLIVIKDDRYFQRPHAVGMFARGNEHYVVSVDFGSRYRKVVLYSLNQQKVINHFTDTNRLQYMAIGEQFIAVSGYEKHILIFDLALNLVKTIETESSPTGLAFSPDGKLLLAGSKETTDAESLGNNVYDVGANFQKVTTYSQHDARAVAVGFLGNDVAVTAGGSGNEIHFWNAYSSEPYAMIRGNGRTVFSVGLNANQIAFGHTQRYQKDANNYAPLEHTFDLAEFESRMNARANELSSFARARTEWNGQNVFVESSQPWDLLVSKNNYDYTAYRRGWYYHEAYGFSDHGYILSGGRGSEVRAYELQDNASYARMKTDFVGHSGRVWDLATQENLLVTGGVDQTIKLWNLADVSNGKSSAYPILNLFVAQNGEWVIWSKSGYYDASLNGDKYIGYHVNQGEDEAALFYTSDRFLKSLYRPDIIKKILETGNEELALQSINLKPKQIDSILPPALQLTGEQKKSAGGQLALNFSVTPASDDITRISILQNGKFVWSKEGALVASGGKFSEMMALLPGKNKFEIFAESRVARSKPLTYSVTFEQDEWSTRGQIAEVDSRPFKDEKPNLYLLAVGVSDYKNNGPNLKNLNFAHIDATEVVRTFQGQQGKAYNKIVSKLLTNDKANKTNIEEGFNWLKNQVQNRDKYKKANRIKSDDVALVFIAGHGVKYGEEFVFLGHDADINRVDTTGVKLMDQGSVITALPSQVILITDACHSGTIGGGIFQNIDSRELSKRLVALNERAVYIINATKKDKPSLERRSLGHGVFTKVLLEGLKDNDEVYIHPLLSFIKRNVKKQTQNAPDGVQEPHIVMYGEYDDYLVHSQ